MDIPREKTIIGWVILIVALCAAAAFFLLRKPTPVFLEHPRAPIPATLEQTMKDTKANLDALRSSKETLLSEERLKLEAEARAAKGHAKSAADAATNHLPDTRFQEQSLPGGAFDFNPR